MLVDLGLPSMSWEPSRTNWSADPHLERVLPTSSLITNGGFDTDVSGWVAQYGVSAPTWATGGHLQAVGNGTNNAMAVRPGTVSWPVSPGQTVYVRARVRMVSGQTPTGCIARVVFGSAGTVTVDPVGWQPDGDGWHDLRYSAVVPAGYTGQAATVYIGPWLPVSATTGDVMQLDQVIVSTEDVPFVGRLMEWPMGVEPAPGGGGEIVGSPDNPVVAGVTAGTPWAAYLVGGSSVSGTIGGPAPTWPSSGTIERLMVGEGDFFDGDTPDTSSVRYEWTGTPGESPSQELVLQPVAGEAPRVDVSITDLPVGTVDVSITRIVEGVEWPVRTAGVIIAGSGAYTEDHEAPTGIALFYRVVASGSDGGLLAEAQESVPALADAPHSMVWLSDPLTAGSAVLVTLLDNGAGGSYDIDARSSFPRGSRLAHTSYGTRQASPRSPLIVINSEDDYTTVMSLLSGPVLIRPPRHLLWGPAIYGIPVGLGDSVDPHAPEGFDAEISFTVTPSRGPGVDVLVPRRTWGDVLAEAVSWRSLMSSEGGPYLSWRDVLRGQE